MILSQASLENLYSCISPTSLRVQNFKDLNIYTLLEFYSCFGWLILVIYQLSLNLH